MHTVYVDELFILNLIINYILLLVTAKICATDTRRRRLLAAAVFGALYAIAAVTPFGAFLVSPVVKIAAGAFMAMCAFGGQPRIVRLTLVFFAVSAAFGGIVMATSLLRGGGLYGGYLPSVSLRLLIVTFAVSYIALSAVFRRAGRQPNGAIVALKLRHDGREVTMRALRDTGNALKDPMTGKSVIITGVGDIKMLLPPHIGHIVGGLRLKGAVKILEELGHGEKNLRFQLIPYSAVGVAGGMLLAFKPDEIIVEGHSQKGMLLALSPNSVSESGTYSALLGA